MNVKKLLLWMVLVDFALYSTWVLWDVGYLGIWAAGFQSAASLQILLDLVICAGLFCVWMVADARQRGVNPWPWVVATLALGSLVPLTYLLVREYASQPVPRAA